MEVCSYGGTSTESSGPRPDPEGPVGDDRRRGRPDRRGHHRHRADPQLPDPLPARQEPGLAPDLHPARQAGPTPRRHPGRLRRLHDPGPVRRRLRPRLRRVLPQPPLRRRPEAPRSTRAPNDDASTTPRRRAPPGRARLDRDHRRLLPAVVRDLERARAAAAVRATRSAAAASSSSSSASRSSPCWPCPTRPATRRSALDRPLSFLILAVIGWLALAIRVVDLATDEHRGAVPDPRLRPVARGARAGPAQPGRVRHGPRAAGLTGGCRAWTTLDCVG